MKTRIGFYPGSFDPVTYGHLDIIARAARLVDHLVLGAGVHYGKPGLLAPDVRLALLKDAATPLAAKAGVKLTLITFDGLAVDAARKAGAGLIIRGLRDASDFDYEVQMAQMNAAMDPTIETVFLAAGPGTRMIASSLVKQIAAMGGDISAFVPDQSAAAIRQAIAERA